MNHRLVGLMYILATVVSLAALMSLSSCAGLHDTTWDIGPTKNFHKKAVKPEDKPANLLTPKEVGELKKTHPEAFLPALPPEQAEPKPVAPERVWSVWRHESDEREQLKLPIIIFEFDPDAHP